MKRIFYYDIEWHPLHWKLAAFWHNSQVPGEVWVTFIIGPVTVSFLGSKVPV